MDQLEIIVMANYGRDRSGLSPNPLPIGEMYREVITDQELVQHAREVISNLEQFAGRNAWADGPYFTYTFRFTTDGMTTLTYSGSSARTRWYRDDTVSTTYVAAPGSTRPSRDLMTTLSDRYCMPTQISRYRETADTKPRDHGQDGIEGFVRH
jgi:hypothetical protein